MAACGREVQEPFLLYLAHTGRAQTQVEGVVPSAESLSPELQKDNSTGLESWSCVDHPLGRGEFAQEVRIAHLFHGGGSVAEAIFNRH